jgi:hypothetical protein
MHALKVGVLLVVTLGAMRGASWLVGWLLARAARRTTPLPLGAANLACLAVFVALLWWNLVPGEPLDPVAFAFGAVVFGLCLAVDLRWRPWR